MLLSASVAKTLLLSKGNISASLVLFFLYRRSAVIRSAVSFNLNIRKLLFLIVVHLIYIKQGVKKVILLHVAAVFQHFTV